MAKYLRIVLMDTDVSDDTGDAVFTIDQAASMLGVSSTRVRQLIDGGMLTPIELRIGKAMLVPSDQVETLARKMGRR